jgi:hypothetical protein
MLENLRNEANEFVSEIKEDDGVSAVGLGAKENFPQRLRDN